jgi:hypothetical protein
VGVTALLRGSDVPRDLPGADDVYGGDQDELSRGNTTVVAPGGTVVTGRPRGPEAWPSPDRTRVGPAHAIPPAGRPGLGAPTGGDQ